MLRDLYITRNYVNNVSTFISTSQVQRFYTEQGIFTYINKMEINHLD